MAKLTEQARKLAHRLPHGHGIPMPAARPRNKNFVPAKAVGTFVPRLTQKAFEKYGFSAATLLTDWAAIVGTVLARDTLPERLKWPRGVEAYGEPVAGAEGRPGATLILKVDPARALDIEYKRVQILERINSYFGYRAVAEIKLTQGVITASPRHSRDVQAAHGAMAATPKSVVAPDMSQVMDDGLRAALERLYAGVRGTKR